MSPRRSPNSPVAGRDAILAAARTEFAKSGFHGTRMRDIAERAQVSQGLLHHHFQSKEELWNIVGEQASDEFLAYVAGAISPEPLDAQSIPTALRTYLRYWREHPEAFRINLWRQLDGPNDERKSRSRRLNEKAVPLFMRAQQADLLRSDLPTGLVFCAAGALVQFWLHSRVELQDAIEIGGAEMPDDDRFVESIMKLIGGAK